LPGPLEVRRSMNGNDDHGRTIRWAETVIAVARL
jgi:hypothetical protein